VFCHQNLGGGGVLGFCVVYLVANCQTDGHSSQNRLIHNPVVDRYRGSAGPFRLSAPHRVPNWTNSLNVQASISVGFWWGARRTSLARVRPYGGGQLWSRRCE
jgi:hypothetical protein